MGAASRITVLLAVLSDTAPSGHERATVGLCRGGGGGARGFRRSRRWGGGLGHVSEARNRTEAALATSVEFASGALPQRRGSRWGEQLDGGAYVKMRSRLRPGTAVDRSRAHSGPHEVRR